MDHLMVSGRGSVITGWGTALPNNVVTNVDLSTKLDTSDEWIRERTGISSRRALWGPFSPGPTGGKCVISPPGGMGTTAVMAVEAGERALESSGLARSDIDLLILCTSTPDQAVPATSAPVSAALGLKCGAFDVNAACSGFLHGLVAATSMVHAGADRVLLIGAETCSRITDWEDRNTAVLFGDGAGAVVIEAVAGKGSLLGWDLGGDGSLQPILYADVCGYYRMEGKEVFRRAVRAVVASTRAAMERAGVEPTDIDVFVPHQANTRIIEAVCTRLGIPIERAAIVLDHTGNTSAASIPLALVAAIEDGRVADDALVLLTGFGGGMAWGSAVWRWRASLARSGPVRD
jgi:3-oxoacyl-[acyl-carrier-protein] synthase III